METPELLFAAVGRTVQALDRYNGRPVWRVKLPRLLGGGISMILPHSNEVFVARGGYVYCLDRLSGNVLWERGIGTSGHVTLLAVDRSGFEEQQAVASAAERSAAAAAAAASG